MLDARALFHIERMVRVRACPHLIRGRGPLPPWAPPRPTLAGVREAVANRHRGGLGPRAHVELGEDPRDVDAGRPLGHEQRRADLAVRGAVAEDLVARKGVDENRSARHPARPWNTSSRT